MQVVGLTAGKAVLTIDGKPRTLGVGAVSPEGVRLVAASSDGAVVEIDGRRQALTLGSGTYRANSSPSAGAILAGDARGHYFTTGSINGVGVKFLVDTGATLISLSDREAKRLGVNYLRGERGMVATANGPAAVYRTKLDEVRVGDIVLHNVDAWVIEGDRLSTALLGMSFLNRVDMKRDGANLVLTKRF